MENEYNIGDLLVYKDNGGRYRVVRMERGSEGVIYTVEAEHFPCDRQTVWGTGLEEFSLVPEPKPSPIPDLKSHFHFDVSLVEAAVLLGALCGEPDLLEHAKAIAKRLLLAAAQRD
jgi:hypothetical protein